MFEISSERSPSKKKCDIFHQRVSEPFHHVGAHWLQHPGREKDPERSENLELSVKSCRVAVSVFVPLSVLQPVLVEDPLLSEPLPAIWTHLHYRLPGSQRDTLRILL